MSDQKHISLARKRDALRQQGILNSHPRDVTHPLFQNSEFFDSGDLLQVKYEMLREVQVENKSVSRRVVTSKPNDSATHRDRYGFRAILRAQLLADVPQVHFDRLLVNGQLLSNIAVLVPRSD